MRKFLSILGTAIVLSTPAKPESVVDVVKAGNAAVVKKTLLLHGDPNSADPDGTTALHWAVQRDRLDMVQALLSAGAKVKVTNRWGVTPLALAVTNGNPAITQALLKAGADPRHAMPQTGTPLLTAARSGNPDVIKALLAAGVNANEAEESSGQTRANVGGRGRPSRRRESAARSGRRCGESSRRRMRLRCSSPFAQGISPWWTSCWPRARK